ncbi:MAG: hypothetical protein AAGH53_03745 [Pseudomonadota bacterium]
MIRRFAKTFNAMRQVFLIAAALLAISFISGVASAQTNPSFDCQKARTPQEKLICSDSSLAKADRAMAQSYRTLLANNRDLRREIVINQRQWLRKRDDRYCLKLGEREQQIRCIESSYDERRQQLQSKELLVCGPAEQGEARFSISCHAPNLIQRSGFTLSGNVDGLVAELEQLAFLENGTIVQELAVEGTIWSGGIESALRLMDIDFDGHPDLQLWNASSAGPNMGYRYFLYQPETNRLAVANVDDQLSGFEIFPDPQNKTITVTGRVSCCQWANTRYHWVKEELRLLSVRDDGSGLYWDLPFLGDKTPPDCLARTRHYNDREELTHIEIAPGGICEPEGDADIITFLNALRKDPQGYRLDIADDTHFTIIYDQPQETRY